MATSGTATFNMDFTEIAEEAWERAGREMRSGYDLRTARRSMNLLTIEWQNRGINMWTIEEGTINTSAKFLRDEKGNLTTKIDIFTLNKSFTVETSDVDLARRLAKESTDLIRRGIDFRSYPPSYFYTKLEDLKLDLLEKGAANSKLRAERLAKSAGNKITGVISASQGIFQITKPNSTETSSWGMYDTTTIEKKVRAVVTIEFRTE